jgi:hypothetical protein
VGFEGGRTFGNRLGRVKDEREARPPRSRFVGSDRDRLEGAMTRAGDDARATLDGL